jgi:arsenate reductase-like glutaredoxin family protein
MLSTFSEQNSAETTKMLNNLLQDWEGGEMSMSDYNHLAAMSTEELKQIYKDLGINAKKIFGSEEAFLKKVDDTKKILNNQNKAMKTSVEAMFGKDAKIPNWNIPPEIGS